VILGATATGKSELAAGVAASLPGEVVSVDAFAVYRGLDIGTAKPTLAQRALAPHHLVDVVDPGAACSVADWLLLAERAVADIHRRGRVPVAAGGTGMYLRALLQGLVESPTEDGALRDRLRRREELRPGSLHRLLRRLDPGIASRTPPRNAVRLIRALEHRILSGQKLSAGQREWSEAPRYRAFRVGLELPRDEREARIRRRVKEMLRAGLVEETRTLLAGGVPADAPSLRAIGYAQASAVLGGRLREQALEEAIVIATRQLAKRQDTWFRREGGVTWMTAPRSDGELAALVERVMLAFRSWVVDASSARGPRVDPG
jgi:tRNA dimethylallyltransferase